MNLRLKGRLDLRDCSRKRDCVAAIGDVIDGESLLLKPRFDFGKIVSREAELAGILPRSNPLMVERRPGGLLLFKKSVERGLLFRRGFEVHRHPSVARCGFGT